MIVYRSPQRAPVVKARRPERPINREVRARLVRILGPLWQNVADGWRREFDDSLMAASVARGGADLTNVLRPFDGRAAGYLATAFRDAIEAGSRIGARHSGVSGGREVDGAGITARAERWIQTQGAKRISRITATTRASVRDVLIDQLRDRVTPTRAAQDIGRLTGLTRQQARSALNFERTLIAARIPTPLADTQFVRESIAQDVERFRDRLLRARGAAILETETQAAIQAGERIWWEQAGAQEIVSLEATRKRWVTVLDERVCRICEPLHGVTVRFDELFDVGGELVEGPPAHPACRCFLDYDAQGFGES